MVDEQRQCQGQIILQVDAGRMRFKPTILVLYRDARCSLIMARDDDRLRLPRRRVSLDSPPSPSVPALAAPSPLPPYLSVYSPVNSPLPSRSPSPLPFYYNGNASSTASESESETDNPAYAPPRAWPRDRPPRWWPLNRATLRRRRRSSGWLFRALRRASKTLYLLPCCPRHPLTIVRRRCLLNRALTLTLTLCSTH
jgi:hypothetical protein